MAVSLSKLLRASRLSGKGRWVDAAVLVQQALGMKEVVRRSPLTARRPPERPIGPPAAAPAPAPAVAPGSDEAVDRVEPVGVAPVPAAARPASFTSHTFTFAGERHTYRLFVPALTADQAATPRPLVVMLHGCKQDAADFARGTGMNALAQEQGCLVLYPEQRTKANGLRCWNWFEPTHQLRGGGEPALLAALVERVLAREKADRSRVYVGGLSAGAAMAALMAALYPEMFAATGLHSGLPAGAARNVVSAFRVMRSGAEASSVPVAPAVPTLVVHGTADQTVNPDNGDNLVAAALAGFEAAGTPLAPETSVLPDMPRPTTRTQFRDRQGKLQVEQWRVDGGPHAWSGGSADGSFTDPDGPAASRAMLSFWLQHRK